MLTNRYRAMLWLFQSDVVGAEAQRTETVMVNLTDIDERLQNRQARIAHVDRNGWLIETSTDSRISRSRGAAGIRKSIGHAIVRWGEWLQGAKDAESAVSEGWSNRAR